MDAALYRRSLAGGPALRVGLVLGGTVLPRWASEVVRHVLESDFAKVELLVLDETERVPVTARVSLLRTAVEALSTAPRSLVYRLYRQWDQRNAEPSTDPLAPVDFAAKLAGIETLRLDPAAAPRDRPLPASVVEAIRARDLDVVIHLGSRDLRGDVLSVAKHGVWAYLHGDDEHYRGGPAYFWEVRERNPVSGAVLHVLADEPQARKVLYKGLFATHEGLSQARNRVQPYWGASTFVIQKLRELHEFGVVREEPSAPRTAPAKARPRQAAEPGNLEMLVWLVPQLVGKFWHRLTRRPTVRHWRLAIRVGGAPVPSASTPLDMSGFRWIDSPKGRCYADPFVIEADGRHWVYFEDFDYASQTGRISCAEVRDGQLGQPMPVLQGPNHISYPCVFRDGGSWYMIPETVSSGAINLYRCTRFPDGWQLERELLKGFAVDTTIWIENGTYWFFVTFLDPRGGGSQLWLYSAPSLQAPWTPHPQNPISTDVRYARGGGAVFRHEGRLYRPSQDGRVEYGHRTILNEIVVMDAQRYREEPRVTLDPVLVRGLLGIHTYGRAGPVEFIDGKMRLPARLVA